MITEEFENKILEKGLTPIHLFLKGKNVKWFVCLDERQDKKDVIIFDRYGKAYEVANENFDLAHEINITQIEGEIIVDGKQNVNRREDLDL